LFEAYFQGMWYVILNAVCTTNLKVPTYYVTHIDL
jgi:hypothetical protein